MSGAARRAARAASMVRDEEAQEVARQVYGVAATLPRPARGHPVIAGQPVPLAVGACLHLAGAVMASPLVRSFYPDATGKRKDRLEGEVAAYVILVFWRVVQLFDEEQFAGWLASRGEEGGPDGSGSGSVEDGGAAS